MKYVSTRGAGKPLTASQAINSGLAADGGLYVPEQWPHFEAADFDQDRELSAVAMRLLAPFFSGDQLADQLPEICREAFNFPTPVSWLDSDPRLGMLELYHGPTSAFKDVGARFLAACLTRLEEGSEQALNILVATSGDTGGAVAAAFDQCSNINVVVLFPDGLVSPRQQHQLCCWHKNIISAKVKGRFDDCQALVKSAFTDRRFSEDFRLTSANSISIGRLLPQMSYYALASLQHWREHGEKANFIIPTGNVGNAQACLWARRAGLPIGEVILATNANRTIPEYLQCGEWQPQQSVATLASAMDVGNPSNMERLMNMHPSHGEMCGAVSSLAVSDEQIESTISTLYSSRGVTVCPHTATAFFAYDKLAERRKQLPWILVATAHPSKFEAIVEPLIGETVPMPAPLSALLERPAKCTTIAPDLEQLRAIMPH